MKGIMKRNMKTPILLNAFIEAVKFLNEGASRASLTDIVHFIKITLSDDKFWVKNLKPQLTSALKFAIKSGQVVETDDGKYELQKAGPKKAVTLPKKAVKVRKVCSACRKKAARDKKRRAQRKRKAAKRAKRGRKSQN